MSCDKIKQRKHTRDDDNFLNHKEINKIKKTNNKQYWPPMVKDIWTDLHSQYPQTKKLHIYLPIKDKHSKNKLSSIWNKQAIPPSNEVNSNDNFTHSYCQPEKNNR